MSRVAAVATAALAAARCLSPVLPEVWFDVDPVLDPDPAVGMSPTMVMWIDMIIVFLAGVMLAGEAVSRRGGDLLVLALWFLPMGLIILWALRGTHHAQVAVPWIAGVSAAAALAHACRDSGTRRAVLSVLIAISGPLVLQGFVQWGWTIPDTIAWFEVHQSQVLASLGLEPGSAAALVYERRLMDGGASGWFSSPNVYGGVLAGCAVAWSGLFVQARRRNASAYIGGVLLVSAAASAAVVGLSGSVGGLVVLGIGLALLAIGSRGIISIAWARRCAVLIPLCAAAAPLAAAMLGDAALAIPGGRSLVIRGQYAQGAVAIIASEPVQGVGPGGFQDAWLQHRPPAAPEEITSAHAMAVDWWAAAGAGALAWAVLVMILAWRVGGRVSTAEADPEDGRAGAVWAAIGGVGAAAMAASTVCSAWPSLDAGEQVIRVAGLCLVPVLAWAAAVSIRGAGARWAMLGAVVLLLAHAQVDMLLHNPASVVWVLALLGGASCASGRGRPVVAGAGAALAAGVGLVIAVVVLPRIQARDAASAAAANLLINAPGDAGPMADAEVRMEAAKVLQDASWASRDPRLLVAAADQFLAAARPLPASHPLSVACLAAGGAAGEFAALQGSAAGAWRWLEAAYRAEQPVVAEVMDAAEAVVRTDPSAPRAWVALARVRRQMGLEGAADAWRRAIELDDANTIDPLQRLGPSVRTEAVSGASSPPRQP